MKILMRHIGLAVALALALAWSAASAQELRLRLLSTTDIHANLYDWDYYRDQRDISLGLARTAALIRQARGETPNVMLFDSGDAIQGTPLGDFVATERPLQPGQIHPVVRAMNLLHYDAASFGNHEFNYGLDFLHLTYNGAQFAYATANVFLAGPAGLNPAAPLIAPFVILERDFVDEAGARQHLRVGAIGFVPPQIMQWDRSHLEGRVFTIDIVEAARRYVPQVRAAGADVVIAMVHSGLSAAPMRGMDENSANYLAAVPGIDAILSGHQHLVFPDPSFANICVGAKVGAKGDVTDTTVAATVAFVLPENGWKHDGKKHGYKRDGHEQDGHEQDGWHGRKHDSDHKDWGRTGTSDSPKADEAKTVSFDKGAGHDWSGRQGHGHKSHDRKHHGNND